MGIVGVRFTELCRILFEEVGVVVVVYSYCMHSD